MAASQQLLDLQGLNEELSIKLAAAVSSAAALEQETIGLGNKARWLDAAYEVLAANAKKKQVREQGEKNELRGLFKRRYSFPADPLPTHPALRLSRRLGFAL